MCNITNYFKPVIRFVVLVVFKMLWLILKQERYLWMAHYLEGSGETMKAPEYVLKGLSLDQFYNAADFNNFTITSTSYDMSGFYGRPELFYLVGGFQFEMFECEIENAIYIVADDVYDWHPVIEYDCFEDDQPYESWYFVSPMPIVGKKWVWRLNNFFCHTFFDYSFSGEFGISNYFWDWLGGKPFVTQMNWCHDGRKQ